MNQGLNLLPTPRAVERVMRGQTEDQPSRSGPLGRVDDQTLEALRRRPSSSAACSMRCKVGEGTAISSNSARPSAGRSAGRPSTAAPIGLRARPSVRSVRRQQARTSVANRTAIQVAASAAGVVPRATAPAIRPAAGARKAHHGRHRLDPVVSQTVRETAGLCRHRQDFV